MSFQNESASQPEAAPNYVPPIEGDVLALLDLAKLNKRGEPDTFGATPLDKLTTMAQEGELLIDLLRYTYNIPAGVPLEIADYSHQTFKDRFYNRIDANDDNYSSSLLNKNDYADKPEIFEVITRAEMGHASPAELLLVRQLLGIASVELACLTHPYGYRIELLEDMRKAVYQAVLSLGGEYYEDRKANYRVKEVILLSVPADKFSYVYSLSSSQRLAIADQFGGVAGLLMTRKRTLAQMPDGTIVKERSSFVLRADEAAGLISESDLSAMAALEDDSNWDDIAAKVDNLAETVAALLESDRYSLAIPLSSTIYASNAETSQQVASQPKASETIGMAHNQIMSDAEFNDWFEQSSLGTITTDYDNMRYIGPPPEES